MTIDPLWLIAAFGGGAFGAAIGGQTAFIMTGFLYMVGLGGYLGGVNTAPFMDSVVFGPVFGPHIAFLGGAIAAAYAAKRGYMPAGVNGRDIVTPLAGRLARSYRSARRSACRFWISGCAAFIRARVVANGSLISTGA